MSANKKQPKGESARSKAVSDSALRRRAEDEDRINSEETPDDPSPEEVLRILHELRVHQIELEMQNEELRRAQEDLETTRAKYLDLYDLAPIGYLTVGAKDYILEANLTAVSMLGVTRSALLKRQFIGFIVREDQDIYYRHRKALSEKNEPQTCELRLLNRDGTLFWARLEAVPARDADGMPVCRVMVSNVTDRKLAEEAIIESEQIFRQLAENIDHVFWLTDWKEKKLLYISPAYEKVFGMSVDSAYEDRLSWKKAVHPEDLDWVEKCFKEHADNGTHLEIEYRVIVKGLVKWIHEFAFPVKDENGDIARFINMAEDITERKNARMEIENLNSFLLAIRDLNQAIVHLDDFDRLLEESCEVLLRIKGYIDISIAFYDPEKDSIVPKAHSGKHEPLSWAYSRKSGADAPPCVLNSIAQRSAIILGVEQDQCRLCEFCRHETSHQSIIVPMLNQQEEIMGVITACIEQGQLIHRDEVPLFEEIAGDLVFAYNKIIADEKLRHLSENLQELVDEKTEELTEAHDSLMKQERLAALGQMAASVSHELRNPLSTIINVAYYLKTKFPDMDEKTLQMLDILEKEVERSDRIINNMLRFSRSKPNIMEDVDLNTLVTEFFSSSENIPGNVTVKLTLAEEIPIIQADAEKLKQVLDNLVSNACNAMSIDGGTLTITTGMKGNVLKLSVRDTGHGMAPEVRARIFEPLFSTRTTGFGLGLPIVKTLVEDHGGEISVKSKEGRGSEFIVMLPIEGWVRA